MSSRILFDLDRSFTKAARYETSAHCSKIIVWPFAWILLWVRATAPSLHFGYAVRATELEPRCRLELRNYAGLYPLGNLVAAENQLV
jgi:hypothetical protein